MPEPLMIAIGAVSAGVIYGVVRGIAWLMRAERRQTGDHPMLSATSSWNELSGEFRPIIARECRETHRELSDDTKRMGERLSSVERALIETRGEIATGFAEVKTTIRDAVSHEIEKHERQNH